MNKQLKDLIRKSYHSVDEFLFNISSSFVSLLRMLVLSRYGTAIKSKSYYKLRRSKDCTILATGPSLRKAFDSGEVTYEGNDIFVVNMFVQSSEFWTIKPRFYFLADEAFFSPQTERNEKLIRILSEAFSKVDWCMYLYVPASCVNGGILSSLNNENIKLLKWNISAFDGFKGICHFMYRHNLAMPKCQTVANMALVAAINMGYKNILLYGADHSWTRDLSVNDNNEVCYGDRHIYATDIQIVKKQNTIGFLLHAFAAMFDSHWKINNYAISRGVKIWNCTRGSFIDCYERKYKS